MLWLVLLLGADAGAQGVLPEPGAGIVVSGRLLSEHDAEPLAYANVLSADPAAGVVADEAGYFRLTGLSAGPQTLVFSHIGCDNEELTFDLRADTVLTVYLHHHDNYVETVVVSGRQNVSYSDRADARAPGQLASTLERITGVSSLRSGTAAAKPVADGVYGNRLSLQNNGVAQSGQQWGNDHAPEIDPWVAAYVRVVEGVEALKYAGPTVAATVLIEPAPLRQDEGPAGKVAYGLATNGRGHTLNARLSRGGRTAYRLSGTGKLSGDQRAPGYFLANTGRREANGALQLARFHTDRWTSRLYLSTFNASIGVLRGSHVGNLTDIDLAIRRPEPFFTRPDFTYAIAAPRQAVSHHLVKAETEYRPNDDHRLTFRYGGQLNDRREFDVRRGGRTDRPALSLQQFSHLFEGAWHHELGPDRHLDANVQFDYVTNDNVPGTGVLPLIPDYNANRGSAYLAYHREGERFQYHAGLRFDRQFYEAITISRDLPRRIERFEHTFSTLGASLEARRSVGSALVLRGGLTYRERAPQINELYSSGLHQGVAGIEEGEAGLGTERSLKLTGGAVLTQPNFSLFANAFVQPIDDYIFLEPQPEFRLTVRGAFPVFLYRAGDALLYGTNLRALWQTRFGGEVDARLALVRGHNRTENRPLVYVPTDNLRLAYRQPAGKRWEFEVEGLWVARQRRLEEDQDILDPPVGYAIFDAGVAYQLRLPRNRTWHLRAGAQNAFNRRYRDYLDRQRYYADAPGRNVYVRLSYEW